MFFPRTKKKQLSFNRSPLQLLGKAIQAHQYFLNSLRPILFEETRGGRGADEGRGGGGDKDRRVIKEKKSREISSEASALVSHPTSYPGPYWVF